LDPQQCGTGFGNPASPRATGDIGNAGRGTMRGLWLKPGCCHCGLAMDLQRPDCIPVTDRFSRHARPLRPVAALRFLAIERRLRIIAPCHETNMTHTFS
jgi:hypothetical protein